MTFAEMVLSRLVPEARLTGIDAARGIALFGMMLTHTVVLEDAQGDPTVATFWAGKASALFAVLAGLSIVLSARGVLKAPGARAWAAAAAGLAVRGLIIAAIGLLLGTITHKLAIILVNYGVMFVFAALFLRLRWWILTPLSAVWLTLTPVISHALRLQLGLTVQVEVPSLLSLFDPQRLAEAITLTGYYPVVQWMGYILAGMALASVPWQRWPAGLFAAGAGLLGANAVKLSSDVLTARYALPAFERIYGADSAEASHMMLTGAHGVAPVDTWWWLVTTTPHSGTPFDLWHTTCWTVAFIGLSCLASSLLARISNAEAAPRSVPTGAHRAWLFGLSAPGAMPLTVYSCHAVLLEITGIVRAIFPFPGGVEWVVHVVVLGIISVLWQALVARRGPLETAVSIASRRTAQAIAAAPSPGRSTAA